MYITLIPPGWMSKHAEMQQYDINEVLWEQPAKIIMTNHLVQCPTCQLLLFGLHSSATTVSWTVKLDFPSPIHVILENPNQMLLEDYFVITSVHSEHYHPKVTISQCSLCPQFCSWASFISLTKCMGGSHTYSWLLFIFSHWHPKQCSHFVWQKGLHSSP